MASTVVNPLEANGEIRCVRPQLDPCGRRRQVAGHDHRRQPGWEVDPATQLRPCPVDDASRHVRRRRGLTASTCTGIFTRYRREEDKTLEGEDSMRSFVV